MKRIIIYLYLLYSALDASAQTQITAGHPVYTSTAGLGIGTGLSTPARELHIKSASGSQIILESTSTMSWNGVEWTNGSFNGYSGMDDFTGRFFIDMASNGEDLTILQNGNIGIGTNNPEMQLDIRKGNSKMRVWDGTNSLVIGPWDSTTNRIESSGRKLFLTSYSSGIGMGNNGTEQFSLDINGRIGIGTTTPSQKLEVVGNALVTGEVRTKKIRVSTTPNSWPDYVFEPGYKTFSMAELEAFIMENKHLPEVPSAKEVEANGQDVGAVQTILLKKIEEMTLQMIEMNKRLEKLEEENAALKKKD